jgi:COMPASS component SWD2
VRAAADDDSLRLYNLSTGTLAKTLFAKTFGASRVAFTHAPSCVLAASGARRGGGEHDVRYHSFHDNTYLRFFKARACAHAPAALRRCLPCLSRATHASRQP